MPHLRFVLSSLLVTANLVVAAPPVAAAPQPFHVLLDPGHGGSDHGAKTPEIREADLVLEISSYLFELLENHSEFLVTQTRHEDQFLSLAERVSKSRSQKVDLLVSLHANSAPDSQVQGFEIYIPGLDPKAKEKTSARSEVDAKSVILAELKSQGRIHKSYRLARDLVGSWQLRQWRSMKQAPFYVLAHSQTPAVLIELGFITNPREAKMLLNEATKKQMARQIFDGLRRYKEGLDKDSLGRLN